MIHPDKIFGRLGNRLFEMAALYSFCRDLGIGFYCQDEKYFKRYEREIRAMFSEGIGEPIDEVAIHVRRGDYVDNPFYVDLTKTDYYQNATGLFQGDTFRVFSDDIPYCKEYFRGNNFKFSEGKSELEDMNDMARCKAHIIANSSFSYWGAWLSPLYPDNRVVGPKSWHPDGIIRTVLPEHWEKI